MYLIITNNENVKKNQGSCSLFHLKDESAVETQILHFVRLKAVSVLPKLGLN